MSPLLFRHFLLGQQECNEIAQFLWDNPRGSAPNLCGWARPTSPLLAMPEVEGREFGCFAKERLRNTPGDLFRRMRANLGPAGAVTALAHKLARILHIGVTLHFALPESR